MSTSIEDIDSFLSGKAPVDDDPNEAALADPRVIDFLDRIGKSEGANYNTLVGGRKIDDLSKHPNIVGLVTSAGPSTAFGRYQIVHSTERSKLRKYRDRDYTPRNQDLRAVELMRQSGALDALLAGDYDSALKHAGKEWASLPGSTLPGRKNTSAWQAGSGSSVNDIDSFLDSRPDPADETDAPLEPLGQKPQTSGLSPEVSELAAVGRLAAGKDPAAATDDVAGGAPARIRGITEKYLRIASGEAGEADSRVPPDAATGVGAVGTAGVPPASARPLTVRDAAWHFGMTPDQAQNMTRRQRRVLEIAVAEDEAKRASGQTILPPPLRYQNEMRKRGGLPPLEFNVKTSEDHISPYFQPAQGGELPILTRSGKRLQDRGGGVYRDEPAFGDQPRPASGVGMGDVRAYELGAAQHDADLEATARRQVLQERQEATYQGVIDPRRPDDYFRQSGIERDVAARVASQREAERLAPAAQAEITERDYAGKNQYLRIVDQLANKSLSEIAKAASNAPELIPTMKAAKAWGPKSFGEAVQGAQDYLRDYSTVQSMVAQYEPPNVSGTQQATKVITDMGFDIAKITAATAISGLPLSSVLVGESIIKNADKPVDEQATQAAIAFATGKALEHLPEFAQNTLGRVPGKIGSAVTRHPEAAARTIGGVGFGALSAGETALAGGSTSQIIGAAAGGAGTGAILAGGGPRRILGKAAENIIASEGAPEWLRQTAGTATGKRPVVFQSEPNEAGESRFASVYVDPRNPSDFVAREVSPEEGSTLLGRERPARIVPEAQFDNVFGRPDAQSATQPAPAPMNRQLQTGEEPSSPGSTPPPEPPTGAPPPPNTERDDFIGQQLAASNGHVLKAAQELMKARGGRLSEWLIQIEQYKEGQPAHPPTAGTPRVPEASAAIEAQMDALTNGRGSRKAVIIPTGGEVPAIPEGFRSSETASGTIIYPATMTRRDVRRLIEEGGSWTLLGHVNPETPAATRAVVARSGVKRGNVNIGDELMSSYVVPGREQTAQREMTAQFEPYQPTFEIGGAATEEGVLNDRRKVNIDLQTRGYQSRRRTDVPPAKPETIVTAAIRADDGTITTGKNHPRILLSQGKAVAKDRSGPEYGFITSTGRFVSRAEAAKIAGVPNTIAPGQLYTEDLTAVRKQAEAAAVPPVPEGHTRFYRADHVDALEPQGSGWVPNDPEYVSHKHGKGQMGSETIWFRDVPNSEIDAEYHDHRAVSTLDSDALDRMQGSEPKLFRRVKGVADVSETANLEKGKTPRRSKNQATQEVDNQAPGADRELGKNELTLPTRRELRTLAQNTRQLKNLHKKLFRAVRKLEEGTPEYAAAVQAEGDAFLNLRRAEEAEAAAKGETSPATDIPAKVLPAKEAVAEKKPTRRQARLEREAKAAEVKTPAADTAPRRLPSELAAELEPDVDEEIAVRDHLADVMRQYNEGDNNWRISTADDIANAIEPELEDSSLPWARELLEMVKALRGQRNEDHTVYGDRWGAADEIGDKFIGEVDRIAHEMVGPKQPTAIDDESLRKPGQVATVDDAAHEAATSPTNDLPDPSHGQREAGNYQMGHTRIAGLDVTLEIPEGGDRKGVDKTGRAWTQELTSHYGYIKRSEGADGEQVDVFVKPGTPTDYDGPIFVVNQSTGEGTFDEHKVMIGWADEAAARAGYLSNYQEGWDSVGSMGRFDSPTLFRDWLETGDLSKPFTAGQQAKPPVAKKELPNDASLGERLEGWRRQLSTVKEARDVAGLKAVVDEMTSYRDANGLTARLSQALRDYEKLLKAAPPVPAAKASVPTTRRQQRLAKAETPTPTRRQKRLGVQSSGVKAVEPIVREGEIAGRLNQDMLTRIREHEAYGGSEGTVGELLKNKREAKQFRAIADVPIIVDPSLPSSMPARTVRLTKAQMKADEASSAIQIHVRPDATAEHVYHEMIHADRAAKGRSVTSGVQWPDPEEHRAIVGGMYFAGKNKPSPQVQATTLDSLSDQLSEFFPTASKTSNGAKFALAVAEFDEAIYAKVQPLLAEALELYRGQEPVDALKSLMRDLRDKKNWQMDQIGAMRPYVIRSVQDFAKAPAKLVTQTEKAENTADVTANQTEPLGNGGNGDEGIRAGDAPGTKPVKSTTRGLRRQSGGRAGSEGSTDVGSAGSGVDDGRPNVTDSEAINVQPPSRADSDLAGNGIRYPSDARRERELAGKRDYVAPVGSLQRQGSWRETARTNLDILDLVKRLEAEGRLATPEEQALLVKFTGWGASEIASNLFPGAQYGKPGERSINPSYAREGWKELAERASELFTPEELDSALASTQFAHYTSEGIIRGVWEALKQFGFTGGAIVEPGMGIGLFGSAAPREIMEHSRYTGIEREKLTAAIAKHILQRQAILEADFVKQKLPKNFFDVAIGNPPFARTIITDDPTYKKYRFLLHDYFFAKSIDSVRPGGLLVFVTSHGTMDKGDDKMRKYIDERADLLGAIRLPQTAFKHNAGTEVVTDVLFLRKRLEGEEPAGEKWIGRGDVTGPKKYNGEKTAPISEYFIAHPEMVLGKHAFTGTMRGADEYTVEPIEGNIEDLFRKAVETLPSGVYANLAKTEETVRQVAERDWSPDTKKEGSLYLDKDGHLRRLENGSGVMLRDVEPMSFAGEKFLKSYVDLRKALKSAQYDQLNDGDWETSLAELNKQYDKFVKKHGRITEFTQSERTFTDDDGVETTRVYRRYKNHKLLAYDVESPLVEALEKVTEDGTIEKGAMLLRRTIKPPAEVVIRTLSDALAVSLDKLGALNLAHVAELMSPVQKMSREEIVRELGDSIFEEPGGGWQMADEYLSGYVIDKLEQAEAAAKSDRRFERNITALQKIQPKPLDATSIAVQLGASWIPPEVVSAFAREELGFPRDSITFDPLQTVWTVHGAQGPGVKSRRTAAATWGTADRSPNELVDAALNGHSIKVYVEFEKGKKQLDEEASAKANDIIKKMRETFRSWLWTDAERTQTLVARYNRSFNNIAPREFNGDHLTLPGLSAFYTLHSHQKRAVWRQLQVGNTYLAHAVGAGKTLEMIVGAMEQRRLGLINKPMFTVPNHMLKQFSAEFLEAYPMANILVADETNFSKENRKRFVAQAALNDLDAIIITHTAYGLVRTRQETADIIVNELVSQLMAAIDELDKNDRAQQRTIKELEARIENITRRFQGKASAESRDDVIDFEDLGVDFLYVDEAHAFRKLDFVTNRDKIKGIDPNGSRRALDMLIKTRWLDRQRPGRSLVMASGTPITNTLAELYTVQRFMDPRELERSELSHFDAWAAMFGEAHPDYEMNAAGKYELVERFSRFVNMPELMKRVRQFMDVLTMKQLSKLVKVPTIKGGAAEIVVVPATAHTVQYLKEDLEARIAASRKWKPSFAEPFNPDPLINIITDARLSALDMRFVVPGAPNDPGSKLNIVIDAIIERYHRDKDLSYYTEVGDDKTRVDDPKKGAGQIIFSYAGFGEQVAKTRGFDAKKWVIKRLLEGGVAANEIAFMSDYKTATAKQQLFKDMRQGIKRLLFGSPMNMGTGVNAQKRLKTSHYIVPPWYPADIEQPDGRTIRQGNQNEEVEMRRYATKGTYDSTNWQMLARKSRSIEQVLQGDDSVRTLDDITESSMYEMASAMAAGDARAIQLAGLRREVERLSRLERAHWQEQGDLRGERKRAERDKNSAGEDAAKLAKAIDLVGGFVQADNFTVTVGNQELTKRVEIGDALKTEWLKLLAAKRAEAIKSDKRMTVEFPAKVLGRFPLTLKINAVSHGVQSNLEMKIGTIAKSITSAGWGDAIAKPDEYDSAGLATRIFNALNGLQKEFTDEERLVSEADRTLRQIDAKLGQPFPEEADLYEKTAELNTLQREMAATAEAETAESAPAPDAETGDAAELQSPGGPAQALGDHDPLSGLDDRTPKYSATGNRITINQSAANLLGKVYGLKPGKFQGIRLDTKAQEREAVVGLRYGHLGFYANRLADLIQKQFERFGSVNIALPERMQHEVGHEVFESLIHPDDFNSLAPGLSEPSGVPDEFGLASARETLLSRGYDDSAATLVNETIAFIFEGRAVELGMTEDQAVRWLSTVIDAAVKRGLIDPNDPEAAYEKVKEGARDVQSAIKKALENAVHPEADAAKVERDSERSKRLPKGRGSRLARAPTRRQLRKERERSTGTGTGDRAGQGLPGEQTKAADTVVQGKRIPSGKRARYDRLYELAIAKGMTQGQAENRALHLVGLKTFAEYTRWEGKPPQFALGYDPWQQLEDMASDLERLITEEIKRGSSKENVSTSGRMDQLAADRAELDLPELPTTERKAWQTTLDNAKAGGLDRKASVLADEIIEKPRALNDEETAGVVLRMQALKNDHRAQLKKIGEANDVDGLEAARSHLWALEREFDRLTRAVKLSGTEKGRALASQRLTINRDYDLISILQRAKAALGRDLSETERAKYEEKIDELRMLITDLEKEVAKQQSRDEHRVAKGIRRITVTVTRARTTRRSADVLDRQADIIKDQLAAAFARVGTTGGNLSPMGLPFDPSGQISKLIGQLARNRAEKIGLGVKASDLVAAVHDYIKDLGAGDEISERDVAEAISGYGKTSKPSQRTELQKEIDRIRGELRKSLGEQDSGAAGVAEGGGTRGLRSSEKKLTRRAARLAREAAATNPPALSPTTAAGSGKRPMQGPKLTNAKEGPKLSDINKLPAEGPPSQTRRQKRLEKTLEELERKLAMHDLEPGVAKPKFVPDETTFRIMRKIDARKREIEQKLRRDAMVQIDVLGRHIQIELMGRRLMDVLGLYRAIETSWDLSFGLRQGKIGLARHPVMWGKSFVNQFKGVSEAKYDRFVYDLENDGEFRYMERFKLPLPSIEGRIDLSGKNEEFQTALADKIPVVKQSEQMYNIAGDTLRSLWFKHNLKILRAAGFSPDNPKDYGVFFEAARQIADFTGRTDLDRLVPGNIGKGLNAATPMINQFTYAVRFWASRLKILSQPFNPKMYPQFPFTKKLYESMPRVQRVEAWKTLFAFWALVGVQLLLMDQLLRYMGWGGVEWTNVDSPDWLKIRAGSRHYDPLAGFQSHMRMAARTLKRIYAAKMGYQVSDKNSVGDILGTYFRTKESPAASRVHNIFLSPRTKEGYGTDFKGDPVYPFGKPGTSFGRRLLESPLIPKPLTVQDAISAYDELGWNGIATTTPFTLLGEGVSIYGSDASSKVKDQTAKFPIAAKELERLKGEGFSGEIHLPKQVKGESDEAYRARAVAEADAALKQLEQTVQQPWYKVLKTKEQKQRVLQGAITSGRQSARAQLKFVPPPAEQTPDVEE